MENDICAETNYLRTLQDILQESPVRNRTEVPTRRRLGVLLRYPLKDAQGAPVLPLITTKRVPFRIVFEELLWFLSGKTHVRDLQANGVHIWDGNTSREFLDKVGLQEYNEGETGKAYPFLWRHYGATYVPEKQRRQESPGVHGGVDQIACVIESLKKNPTSRRHVVDAWDPTSVHEACLPPCHYSFCFHATPNGESYDLSCSVVMRSNDMFLGHPFNVVSYGALTHMIAKICGYGVGEVIFHIMDAHIYETHVEQVREQIKRKPFAFPALSFSKKIEELATSRQLTIDDFAQGDLRPENYKSHPTIKGQMVV